MPAKDATVFATVIATFSRRMRVRFADDQEADARIKGKKLKPVCGDKVTVEPIDGEADWLITSIDQRRNELTRPNLRGQVETLAANLDLVVVVAAASPKPDWFIVDRYLCAAENMRAEAAVVYNKTDLDTKVDPDELLKTYRDLGYPGIACSAETNSNIDPLANLLTANTSIIVGQSGVGKSSLINQLVADSQQRTAELSSKSGEGRHTTVNSVMIGLQNGGSIIDSPGVRDYAPALSSSTDAALGFREIAAAAQSCRFANCRHLREPGCAVKEGVDQDTISYRRYESFRRVVNLTEKLAEGKY